MTHSKISLSGDFFVKNQGVVDQFLVVLSGVVDGNRADFEWWIDGERNSDSVWEDVVLSGNGKVFRDGTFVYVEPKKIYRNGGVWNVKNRFFEELLSGMIGNVFQFSFDFGFVENFSALKNRDQNSELQLFYDEKIYFLRKEWEKFVLRSEDKVWDVYFSLLYGKQDETWLHWEGRWGKFLIDVSLSKKDGSNSLVFQVDEVQQSEYGFSGNLRREQKRSQKSLQSFSKPYTTLQQYLEHSKIDF